jgi:hypothetical protein
MAWPLHSTNPLARCIVPVRHLVERTYPRSIFLIYHARSLAHRGRRRSRRLMTERGGCADNAHSVEPREAQRPTSLAARTPKRRPLATGTRRGCDQTDPRQVRMGPRKPLAPPGAPSPPLWERTRKTGYGRTRRPNQRIRAAERWLRRMFDNPAYLSCAERRTFSWRRRFGSHEGKDETRGDRPSLRA